MLKTFGGGHDPVLPSKQNLGEWVDAEFDDFIGYLKFMLEKKYEAAEGKRFCQTQHDGCKS